MKTREKLDNPKNPWDLIGADFRNKNLVEADFAGANLWTTDFDKSDLTKADLSGAYLRQTRFRKSDLIKADLSKADLSKADFAGATLKLARLTDANLNAANLSRCDLYCADFRGANLWNVDLTGSDIATANFGGLIVKQGPIRSDGIQYIMFTSVMGGCVIRAGDQTWIGHDAFNRARHDGLSEVEIELRDESLNIIDFLEIEFDSM